MSALHRHVADYLRMRRALGYRLERAGLLLPQLVDYLEAAGASTRADIARVMQHAEGLHPRLRAATFQTVFGLLVVTGMRLGEVVCLTRDDVDTVAGVITIRHAKFDRVRLVPLHPTTTAALQSYAAERDRLCPHPRTASFFINTTGTPVQRNTVEKTLRTITTAVGIRTATVHPRAHDLRHRFAVETLIHWHTEGLDVGEHMAVLQPIWAT